MRLASAFVSSAASLAALALGSGALLSGCKSSEAARAVRPGWFEPDAPPVKPERPAESSLALVKNDMSPDQVVGIMGSPTGQTSYPTAKTYNPFGNDSGNRVVYMYEGRGRVLFAVPKNGGDLRVLRVDVDPAEDGQ